jgi:hypothetical protein
MKSVGLLRRVVVALVLCVAVLFGSSCASAGAATGSPSGAAKLPAYVVYRLYNTNSGEHFYTTNEGEQGHLFLLGWRYEGVGWVAPGADSGDPVYRLYNPNAGDHFYTTNLNEKNSLVKVGWRYEGVGWYSDPDAKGGVIPLYRQYNPNAVAGAHNYTTNLGENNSLVKAGWRAEGTAWYGLKGLGLAGYRCFDYYFKNDNYKIVNADVPDSALSSSRSNNAMAFVGPGSPPPPTVTACSSVMPKYKEDQ